MVASVSLATVKLVHAEVSAQNEVSEQNEVESFVMHSGASVRMDDKRAIRFRTSILKADLETLQDMGEVKVVTMIAPLDYINEEPFEKDSAFDKKEVVFSETNGNLTAVQGKWNSATNQWDILVNSEDDPDYDSYVFMACLYNVLDDNLLRQFAARSYISVNGEVYDYTDYNEKDNARSIGYVANRTLTYVDDLQDEERDNLLALRPLRAEITNTDLNVCVGEDKDITYSILDNNDQTQTPEDGTISFVSSDESVAKVENGKLIGVKEGSVDISLVWNKSERETVISLPVSATVTALPVVEENATYEGDLAVKTSDKTLTLDSSIISVDKVTKVSYNGEDVGFSVNTAQNALVLEEGALIEGEYNELSIVTSVESQTQTTETTYAVKVAYADYIISTAEEFEANFVNKVNTEYFIKDSYVLLADIDATGMEMDTVQGVIGTYNRPYAQFHYTAKFNGLGHTVDGLTAKGALFHSFFGTMKNVAFTNMKVTAGTYEPNFPAIVARQGGGTIDNCYFQATFEGDFTAIGGIFSNIPSGYVNDSNADVDNPVVISNTVVNTNIVDGGNLGGNIAWAMANSTRNSITMTNVFVINESSTLMFGSSRIGDSNTVTLQNGNDQTITLTTTTLSTANNYKYSTIEAFKDSTYGALFTGDMWDGILRAVKEETTTNKSYTGYLGISTANAEQVSGKDATVILDSDQIDVSTLNKLTYNGEELEFTIDETDNSVTFTYSSLIKGVVNSVVFTTKEETAKTIDYTNYTVSVAVADYAISTKDEFKTYFVDYANDNIFVKYTYMLLADIDATGMEMDTVQGLAGTLNKPYAQFHYNAVLDGLGHTVDGLTAKGALFHSFFGTMKNVAFTNMKVTAGTYEPNFPAIVARQGGGTIDNCYFQATFEGDFTAIGGIFSNIPSGYVNDSNADVDNPVVISNTVVNTNIVDGGNLGGNIAWAMANSTRNSITMTNVFVINESSTLMFGSSRIGDSNTVTLQNGNDQTITLTTTTLSTANNYKYSTIEAFKDSTYGALFTGDMWDSILGRNS